jgi:succinoglycan biosynthesis protein ExoA
MSGTSVAVVIPARDAAATLPRAVAAVLAQRHDGPLEVVIAVGPSDDATAEVAASLAADPRVSVVENSAGTTPAGLNCAIAASTGDVVVRVDAQSVIPQGYLERVVEVLAQTGASNAGGRQVPAAEGGFAACVAAAMASRAGSGGPVDTVYLGAFPRAALEAVGGYDERLVRNQDYELNWRLRDAGGTIHLVPELAVAYRPRDSVGALWQQYFDYGRWKRVVLRLHPGSVRPRQLAAPVLTGGLLASFALAIVTGRRLPLLPVGAYATAVVAAGTAAAPRPDLAPGTALAIAVMHLAWGCGFLFGRRPRLVEGG